MEIGKDEVIQIFKANYNYNIVETKLGKGIVMPAKEAFIFCEITNAGYLTNPILPFTPKGRLKLFYTILNYKFVTGMFENSRLNNTPYLISISNPTIFNCDKIIIPVEFVNELDLQKSLKQFINSTEKPENYIVLRIEKSKKGNGMEPFMEYLATTYFSNLGFIVENQIPLTHSLGNPDFGGYQLKETFDAIRKLRIFNSKGFHILELSMLRLGFQKGDFTENKQNNAIVGEAKTGTTVMKNQLLKYLESGFFEYGFEMHPSKKTPSMDTFGLLNIDEKTFKVNFYTPSKKYSPKNNSNNKVAYFKWLNNYMKFHIIANFTNDELVDYYKSITNKDNFSQEELVDFVCNQRIADLLNRVISLK
jgi:hypothetical protein